MINISICLSDIPKDRITTSEKNGKKYLSLTVDEMRQADEWKNTHTVYVTQSKDEREAKTPKTYIGKGREYRFEKAEQAEPKKSPEPDDDLPF
jgi:hypothetical protein